MQTNPLVTSKTVMFCHAFVLRIFLALTKRGESSYIECCHLFL